MWTLTFVASEATDNIIIVFLLLLFFSEHPHFNSIFSCDLHPVVASAIPLQNPILSLLVLPVPFMSGSRWMMVRYDRR